MKRFDISVSIDTLTYDELSPDEARVVEAARQATYRSYAPYSHFSVGAAIELSDGTIVTGANQENAAFSAGTCAERSACFYAHAEHPEATFRRIAIAARAADGQFLVEPAAPCGVCRQSLLEYETMAGHPIEVLLAGRDLVYRIDSIRSLLPLAFTEF